MTCEELSAPDAAALARSLPPRSVVKQHPCPPWLLGARTWGAAQDPRMLLGCSSGSDGHRLSTPRPSWPAAQLSAFCLCFPEGEAILVRHPAIPLLGVGPWETRTNVTRAAEDKLQVSSQ